MKKVSDFFWFLFWVAIVSGGSQVFSSLAGTATWASVLLCVVSLFLLMVVVLLVYGLLLRGKYRGGRTMASEQNPDELE